MRLRVLAVGTRMPDWVQSGAADYQKRLPRELNLTFEEIPLARRSRQGSPERYCEQECTAMLGLVKQRHHVVALDLRGDPWSTPQLAQRLKNWMQKAAAVDFLVGGPDGLAPACLDRADERWCLSPLTLPHPLVRVLLAEQIYRAWTILQGHPYHR